MQPNEHVFHGKRDINYLFEKGAKSSPFLLVAFQAVPTVKNGKPNKSYNYTKFLKDINVHRLFIEDTCGEFGCYYLCNNMNFEVEETVIALIESIMKKHKIKPENVITFGSSKGGSAALYYGLKYKFGHIISGAPQTKIATYLSSVRPSMLQYIAGQDLAEENLKKIDAIVLGQVKTSNNKTNINLLTSEKDGQYKTHIVPLIKKIKAAKFNANIVLEPGIEKHRDIATYFPNFLISNIKRIISETYGLEMPQYKHDSNSFKLIEAQHNNDRITTLIEIVNNKGEIIEKMNLSSGDYFEFKTDELVSYCAVYTICFDDEPVYSVTLCDSMFDQGRFKYHGYSMRFNGETNMLEFKIDVEQSHPIAFALTLLKGKDVVVPNFHSIEPNYNFPIEESGTYLVRFAIKVKNEGIIRKNTERFPIAID